MKSRFFKSIEQCGAKVFASLIGLILLPLPVMATDPTYNNSGAINGTPPQVDATNFINSGTWNISTTARYETKNTLNYTNTGTMNGFVGWEFDYGPLSIPGGGREWSANFVNNSPSASIYGDEYLWISATNVINKGYLNAGTDGEIRINGSNVNLARSGIEIAAIQGSGSVNGATNFAPDTAVYSLYWGTNNLNMDSAAIWDGARANTPVFTVNEPCGISNVSTEINFTPTLEDSTNFATGYTNIVYTNMDGSTGSIGVATNIIAQAIFVGISDPNITGTTRFADSGIPTNLFKTAFVRLSMTSTNAITLQPETSSIYIADDLASSTNYALDIDTLIDTGFYPCLDYVYRPANYIVSRTEPVGFQFASRGEGRPAANFFYDPAFFTNSVVTAKTAAYSAQVENVIQVTSGAGLTNQPGRILINANNLDLSNTRMRAESEVTIQASNLVSSSGAVVDCENLSYNFGATNGNLNVANLSKGTVSRLKGTVSMWSAKWTNGMVLVIPNWTVDTNVPPANPPVEADITNIIQVDFHTLFVDARGLSSVVPVTVQDLVLNSTNMTISDTISIGRSFLFNGQSLTLLGNFNLGGVSDWIYTEAPLLRYFTNNGSLFIPNDAHFGDDGPTNYLEFVNNGTISAGSETVNSVDYQSGGSQSVSGGYFVTATSAKVEGGSIASGQDVRFTANTLKLNNSTITAGNLLYFNVTGSLFDSGGSSGNVLTCDNGFDLAIKPAIGDLLGTTLETAPFEFAAVDHYWSGLDLGTSSFGYTNNEAVGHLILKEGTETEFNFHATGSSNAIYVDLLDLSQCPDFLDPTVLTIDPNFVIYFAAVKLPASFTVPPNSDGIPQEPEEFLNGQLGGHLRWISSFAGPNSSVDVVVGGKTVQVNKALRYSKIIDSNGDGTPNYYDANPFIGALVLSGSIAQTNLPPAKAFTISWTAEPNTIYQVQYRTNMVSGSWRTLLSYTNNASTSQPVTVSDTNAMSQQRFYRVSH